MREALLWRNGTVVELRVGDYFPAGLGNHNMGSLLQVPT